MGPYPPWRRTGNLSASILRQRGAKMSRSEFFRASCDCFLAGVLNFSEQYFLGVEGVGSPTKMAGPRPGWAVLICFERSDFFRGRSDFFGVCSDFFRTGMVFGGPPRCLNTKNMSARLKAIDLRTLRHFLLFLRFENSLPRSELF